MTVSVIECRGISCSMAAGVAVFFLDFLEAFRTFATLDFTHITIFGKPIASVGSAVRRGLPKINLEAAEIPFLPWHRSKQQILPRTKRIKWFLSGQIFLFTGERGCFPHTIRCKFYYQFPIKRERGRCIFQGLLESHFHSWSIWLQVSILPWCEPAAQLLTAQSFYCDFVKVSIFVWSEAGRSNVWCTVLTIKENVHKRLLCLSSL